MNEVEEKMLAYLTRRLSDGVSEVSETEILEAVIPPGEPGLRFRPAYRYGLERLCRRSQLNETIDRHGRTFYSLVR